MSLPFSPPPYRPPRWLRNGHSNTIFSFLKPRPTPPAAFLAAQRDHWLALEPGTRALMRGHWQAASAPALLLVHGLEGSSEAGYMLSTAVKAWQRGWHVVRANVRGCGDSDLECDSLYNSGLSGDADQMLRWLLAQPGVTQAALAGFSMGGNIVLKYAGEVGDAAPDGLRAVVAVSAPLDLGPAADALHRPANRLYERRFLRGLTARVRGRALRHPGRFRVERLGEVNSVRAFDHLITAPFYNYRDADDYYHRAAAARVVDGIRVPTLVIHAEDDPFIVLTPATRARLAANPAVHLLAVPHGGHCGFMGNQVPGEDTYWAENRAVEFCVEQVAGERVAVGGTKTDFGF